MNTSYITDDSATSRRATARVPLEVPDTLFGKALAWYSRRTYGAVLDPGLAMLHNRPVLRAVLGFERRVDKWDALDPDLKILAEAASARLIGCSWCIDFGYFVSRSRGLDVGKLEQVQRWRDSDAFSRLERLVLEYAEAMTATPPRVGDDLAGKLRAELGYEAFVELTMIVAVENERSRFNSALGLSSQGFKDQCDLPGTELGA
jgi:alkylhydroperoxidase family enzyme